MIYDMEERMSKYKNRVHSLSLLTDIIQYLIKYDSRNSAWLVNKPLLRGNNSLANYFYTISYRIISTSCQTKSHPQLPVIISLYLATYYS